MPSKISSFFCGVLIWAILMLFGTSCKKTAPMPWPSQTFAGVFSGNDVCLISGTNSNSITVTATSANQVNIANLYGSGKVFYATVSNDSCYIQPQVYNNGSGNALMQGSFVMYNDTIKLSIIISSFGQEDRCNAVLVKSQ